MGTWGEDLFMQRTMDDAEVSKISDFSLTSSGTCPGDRPKDKKKDTKFVPTCTAGGSKALAPLPASSTVRSWSERGGCIFFSHRNDRVRQSSLLAGPALSVFV